MWAHKLTILVVIDFLFFATTKPSESVILIIIASTLVAVTFFAGWSFVAKFLSSFGNLPHSTTRRFVITATAGTTALLLMQSVGQLSIRDFITVLLITCITYAYASYMSKHSRA